MNSSRMDKYEVGSVSTTSRTEKNRKLYEQIPDIDVDYIDIDTNNVMEIQDEDLTKVTRSEYQKRKEFANIITPHDEQEIYEGIKVKQDRIYDIDEILKKAKEDNKADERNRLINTEYNILTKLDIEDINNKDLNEEQIKEIVKSTYPDQEEVDNNQELFYDMIESKEEEEEITREILEKDVEDVFEDEDSNEEFEKNEPEDNLELENNKEVEEEATPKDNNEKEEDSFVTTTQFLKSEKKSRTLLVFIIIIVILIVIAGAYLFFKYFSTL